MEALKISDPPVKKQPILMQFSGNSRKKTDANFPKLLRFPTQATSVPSPIRMPRFAPQALERPTLLEFHKTKQQVKMPKLLNIKHLFTAPVAEKTVMKKEKLKAPKLIRLPNLRSDAGPTMLLESPKRNVTTIPKAIKPPEEPKLLDIRPFTQQQSKKLLAFEEAPSVKDLPLRGADSVSFRASEFPQVADKKLSQKMTLKAPKEFHTNNERSETREAELYEVITELLLERKKHRKRKRLRLFDIIDKIPITSESETDDDIDLLTRQPKRKGNKRANASAPNTGLVFLPGNGMLIDPNPDERLASSSGLPDPPNILPPSLKQYEPKSSYFLDSENKANSPVTWQNIIKLSRNENKETQTLKVHDNSNTKTQSAQTELQEMVDIPRTQTFFTPNDTAEKTREFCDRVRNEVLEKLNKKAETKEKSIQSVQNSACQTSEDFKIHENKILVPTGAKKTSETPLIQSTIDPRLLEKFIHNGDSKSVEKDFINVTDIDSDLRDGTPESLVMDREITSVYDGPKDSNMDQMQLLKHTVDSSRNSTPHDTNRYMVSFEEPNVDLNNKQTAGNTYKTSESLQHLPETTRISKPKATTVKGNLKENIKEFSYGLQALEELQQNLETELKQSKLLFNTITTLQDGFMSDELIQDDLNQAELKIQENLSRYPITNESDAPSAPQEKLSPVPELKEGELLDKEGTMTPVDHQEDASNNVHITTQNSLESRLFADGMDVNEESHVDDEKRPFTTHSQSEEDILNIDGRLRSSNRLKSILSPRSVGEATKNSSVRFSHDLDVLDAELEDGYEEERQRQDDNILREEIRKRIMKPPTEEELSSKQENGKRAKLLDWMKQKRSDRSTKYHEELKTKRENEHRPFVSKRSVTKKEIDRNSTIQHDLKRAMLEENNDERCHVAEMLANDVIARNKGKHVPRENLKRKFMNNRYQKKTTSIPVRETRSSRMRKTALLSDVFRHTRAYDTKVKHLTPKRKNESGARISREHRKVDSKTIDPGLDQSFGHYSRMSGGHSSRMSGGHSSRMSVEANEFVTRDTYESYQKKSSKNLRKTLKEFSLNEFNGFHLKDTFRSPRFSYKSLEIDGTENIQPSVSHQSSVDNTEVKKILQQYGLDVDDEMFGQRSSTSKLLAEVDMALFDDDGDAASVRSIQTIDWNEVDNILNE